MSISRAPECPISPNIMTSYNHLRSMLIPVLATSYKLADIAEYIATLLTSYKLQATSYKLTLLSISLQATSYKIQATS